MKNTMKLAAAAVAGTIVLSACSGGGDDETVHVVGFSILKEVNTGVIEAFQKTDGGKDVEFDTSYAASGEQRDKIISGQPASVAHLSLEPDLAKLVGEGLVAEDWKDNDTNGICTTSVVVIVTRADNPMDIQDWDDLIAKDAEIVTPDPASSGSAKWNALAAYGQALGADGDEAAATDYMTSFYQQIVSQPGSARDASAAFTGGIGDVLLSYENEAIEAKQGGADIDYVVPDTTLKIENPCAVITDDPAAGAAQDFIDFIKGAEAQKVYAEAGFRPLDGVDVGEVTVDGVNDEADPFPAPGTLLTVDELYNGWDEANEKYFGTGEDGQDLGILTDLQAENVNAV